eukprot:COSAG02_NODE_1764_length_11026_cov_4.823465_5_plen_139_part_00
MEEVRKLRRDAYGEALSGAQPDPERESRRALLSWTRRQLYSPKSVHHANVVDFHTFFPLLCKRGRADVVPPAVQKFLKEIADSLELVRASPDFVVLRTNLAAVGACKAPITTPAHSSVLRVLALPADPTAHVHLSGLD